MFRAGTLVLVAAVLAAASALPAPKALDGGQPQSAEQGQSQPKPKTAIIKSDVYPAPGTTARAPLYVEVACEHGCDSSESEQGWWQRLATDPVATFTAVLATLTFFLSWGTIRAANAAKAAVDGLPTVERAYIYPEAMQSSVLATRVREVGGGYFGPKKVGENDQVRKEADISFRLRNVGKTPGVVGPVLLTLSVGGTARKFDTLINETAAALGSQNTTQQVETTIDFTITQNEAKAIVNGVCHITIEGKFTFSDIWGTEYGCVFGYALDYDTGQLLLGNVTDAISEKKRRE